MIKQIKRIALYQVLFFLYQDWPGEFLPDALKNGNPLGIMRKVDGRYTR